MTMAAMLMADLSFLLDDFGSDLTLTRPSTRYYNPATGDLPPGAVTEHTIRGAFINYMDGTVDGSVIRVGDRRLLVRAYDAPVAPEVGDIVEGLRILDVRSIAPNGVAIAWACQARK
jgi:hypothetical protein